MKRLKALETSLVLSTAFLTIFLLSESEVFLYIALSFGITGIFIKPLATFISILWFKFGDLLNFFVSKIVLGTIFFLVLFPISIIYKITNKENKNKLQLKRTKNTIWINRN